jgi:hypothetical protein
MSASLRKAGPAKNAGEEPRFAMRLALAAIRWYQGAISPLLWSSCRYYPSCSQYAYEAIGRYGVARGAWLGCKRLLRCHPLARRCGYDPVPEPGEPPGAAREVRL